MAKLANIHSSPFLVALRHVLHNIPHRPHCAVTLLGVGNNCSCDVKHRVGIAYDVVVSLLLDLRKGQR